MSGTRANASARNKRAGGADINSNGPTSMGQRNQQGQQQMQPQVQPKLSISDAIGLITLRLGRMEQIVQTIQLNPNDPTSIPDDRSGALVDTEVFDNIVKRLEVLEQKQKNAPVAQALAQTPVAALAPAALQNLVTIQKHDIFVKDITNELKEMKELIAKVPTNLADEVNELKDMLMKLQTFTMETNTKLVNVIFSDSPQFEILESEENECDVSQNIDDFNMKFFNSELGSGGFNLKEMIQQELQNENVTELVIEEANNLAGQLKLGDLIIRLDKENNPSDNILVCFKS